MHTHVYENIIERKKKRHMHANAPVLGHTHRDKCMYVDSQECL